MATLYYLTTTASDLSVPGSNFDNELSETAPSTTLALQVATNTTETDYGYTPVDHPSSAGVTGNYLYQVHIDTGNIDLQMSIKFNRINSSGVVQSGSVTTSEQQANGGPLNFSINDLNLGTWASGDRLRVDMILRDTTIHGNENFTYDLGATVSNTVLNAPWTLTTPRYFIIS